MLILEEKINNVIKNKSLSHRQLAKEIGEFDSSINSMIRGVRPFPENVIKKLLPILQVSKEEFTSWILADKYSKEILQLAIEAKKTKNKDKKLLLTAKIDELLEAKGLSRTAFSKQIKYSQSTFNNAITGKESLSKNLMVKISEAFDVPAEHIQAWALADKYSLNILKLAIEAQNS